MHTPLIHAPVLVALEDFLEAFRNPPSSRFYAYTYSQTRWIGKDEMDRAGVRDNVFKKGLLFRIFYPSARRRDTER